eukprot:TRINITY_DN615_c0_g1_i5.p2 TRINITY_DN615_c0_g1~~TRINITY_DN615_c0_g1_i5.p2  ORF type:complete len:106 (+),score=41.34 TRINITY_DN615_c0_g1_i5:174-491(+)
MVQDIKTIEEYESVKAGVGEGIFVVDFYGTVCPPCKAFAPVYDELAKKYPECVFVKVNIDELWEIEDAEDVTGVPYLKVFRAGKEVGSIAGPNADELEKTIKENM